MSKKAILLVEDDELDVISVQRALSKLEMNIQLKTAYNGIEALTILNDSKEFFPDIILLDLNMPKMNGTEFLKELSKKTEFARVKVYVMTTSNEVEDRRETEKYKVSGYIIKPLNFTENTKKSSSMESFMHFQLMKILGEN